VKIRFFLDEDVHAELSHALRNRGFDVLHAQELKRKGKTDREQLEFATEEKRCIFSFNVKDFVILHNQFVKENREHGGIIVSKQLPFRETLERLLQKARLFSQDTIKNRLEFL
jgi:endonuclease/exonuclease/phosphatase family metal-dependent hydrolase